MELRHIRYFLAVADEQNFTRAAERVGIGQPPLSQQIKDLEREVGTPLFRRVPQGARLTSAGEAFLAAVSAFPALADRAVRDAQRAARGETGSLRVGYTGSSAYNRVVPAAIRGFRRAYPQVELVLQEANTAQLAAALKTGEIDAAFIRSWQPDEGFQLRRLSEETVVAALPASHPAAGRQSIGLEELRDDAFILTPRALGPDLVEQLLAACRSAGFEPRMGQTAPQMSSAIALVAAELGVSLVPESMSQLAMRNVVYVALDNVAATARLALAFRRSDTSRILRNFLDCASA